MSIYSGNRSKESSLFHPCSFPGKNISGERLPPFIPGFRLTEFCGKGGAGIVWKGMDARGKVFAFRIVYKKGDPNWKEDWKSHLLYRERVPAHKNLVPLLSMGEKREFCYFVTPLADDLFPGQKYRASSLGSRMKIPGFFPLSPEKIFSLMEALTEAVGFLHKNGIAHNDIKPENILFIKKLPALSDFGLAGELSGKSRGGTNGYRPYWQGAAGKECDLFALGKILYTLFTGEDPAAYPLLPEKLPFPAEMTFFFNTFIAGTCSWEKEKRFSNISAVKEFLLEGEKIFFPGSS